MKQIFICILFMTTTGTSFCQQTKSSRQLTCEEYLTKSKNQKTAARTLLICGGVLIIIPVIIAIPGNVSFDTVDALAVIAGIGVGASLGKYSIIHCIRQEQKKGNESIVMCEN